MKSFGAALVAAGLALGSYSLAQVPGTSLPPGIRSGAVNCTPNTVNGSFANVVGLWHFDNNGTDQAGTPHNISALSGGANYSTTQSKFGGYSLNIVTLVTSYAQISGVGISLTDYTFEAWMYQTAVATYTGMIGDDAATMGMLANPNIGGYAPGLATISATWNPTMGANAWHHVAWVRASNVFHFYYDGTDQGNVAQTGTVTGSATWKIGRGYSATYGMPNNSYLDELRISNVARYTANFTPPVLAFCNN